MKSANDATSNISDALNESPEKDTGGVTAEEGAA
jgi:hypothetical protein